MVPRCLKLFYVHLAPYVLNQPIQCIFKFLCSSFCNWPLGASNGSLALLSLVFDWSTSWVFHLGSINKHDYKHKILLKLTLSSTISQRHLFSKTSNDANFVITWSHNPHAKTPIPWKPSKSGLIGEWHKDNLYLGTSTIGNEKPPPNEYWFANERYKDDATKPVVLR
jgi:hypothetical protein